METAKIAEPISGNKLYQQRARAALPILVRQAQVGTPILYSELASELGMPNPRNLNYVLGSIGQALKGLAKEWGKEIPLIQCLVINKNTGLPGEGLGWFITDKEDFYKLPKKQQRRLIEAEFQKAFVFRDWPKVLRAFGLKLATPNYQGALQKATSFRAGGESEHHKKLKHFVASHPEILQLPTGLLGRTEYPLPSGDSVDVLFEHREEFIGVEVKSQLSPAADIIRGIFQCIKYQAVIEAYQAVQQLPQNTRVVLVLESMLPAHLVPLKNMLGVEILENIKPQ
jgi:hypothetical protein